MMMKKMIAGAALVAVMAGTAAPALANTTAETTTQTTVQTTATTADTTTATTTPESTTTTEATETVSTPLPEQRLTSDDFFYFLKRWIEEIHVVLTRDAAERAALLEEQAQTRMAEAVQLVEAGELDLAQKAMTEAEGKLKEAQKAISAAAEGGKDLTRLAAQVAESEARFAKAVTDLLATMPESVMAELEPLTADLLAQVATTQDAATQDETTAEEAAEVVDEAGLQEQMAGLQPRTVLVLKAMADASDKSLAEVFALYQQNPGFGNIAKQLGLKMGPVQHAAQIEWKKLKAEVEIETADEDRDEDQDVEQDEDQDVDRDVDQDEDRDDDGDEKDDKKASKKSQKHPGSQGLEKATKAREKSQGKK